MAQRKPPYLVEYLASAAQPTATKFRDLLETGPRDDIILPLPGEKIHMSPGDEDALMARDFEDSETMLGLHRFAWLPIMGDDVAPEWVSALWRAWRNAHGAAQTGWPWHPYTAAERVINILDYAGRRGLPGPCDDIVQFLGRHGETIANTLEYFGEHYTGNHLSNNGRGLFLLGLATGNDEFAAMGGRILIEESERIFSPSGMLREGSTHYHLLLTRNYASAWLAARALDRPETAALEKITEQALAALPSLILPGGMPLIGDISPDCPPEFLAGLLPGGDTGRGWTGLRTADEREALVALADRAGSAATEQMERDGWWRFDYGPWAALWHVAPDGWPPMPGHGHQDLGSFDVHFDGAPIFLDPGRGAYGNDGEAAAYASARVHNGLMIDGAEPYPPNRPYYDDNFRRAVDGAPPAMSRNEDGLTLTQYGFRRIKGVGAATRSWRFDPEAMVVTDRIDGKGRHKIVRRLHTTLPVEAAPGGAIIAGAEHRFQLTCDGAVALERTKCWSAYGEAVPTTAIDITITTELPLETTLMLEAV